MLEIKDVSKVFNPGTVNEKLALDKINLTLNEGDFVTVIGGNGAGKSTMLNMVAGVYPVDGGSILIDGKPIRGTGTDRGVVFQHYSLFYLPYYIMKFYFLINVLRNKYHLYLLLRDLLVLSLS